MPTIRTKRSDILRRAEVLGTLKRSEEVGSWLSCLIALAWIFGKRINELLRLEKSHLYSEGNFLFVRFFVSKKKTRKDPPTPRPYLKRISLGHPGVPYITRHREKIEEGKLFPGMYREKAYYWLKKVNDKVWWHLFRESLATEMAEHGATEEELMHWFDWDRVDTAHAYVKRGTKLTEKWSERTW